VAALKARDELGLTVLMVGLAKRHEILYVPIAEDAAGPDLALPPIAVEPGETDASSHSPHETSGFEDPMPREISDIPGDEHLFPRFAPRHYAYRELLLPLSSPGLTLLRKLRDESHRFALTYHRKVRDKRLNGSTLDEIPGVGPRRRRLLLRTFGSIEGIRRASAEEIASVPTMTKTLAQKVRDFLADA
ncbi:MAG: hypothetical protein C4320_02345, partial [Armatimonadota bacterium]